VNTPLAARSGDIDIASVVVVAADSGPPLRACIASVLASSATLELVLVDNASGDGEVDRIASAYRDDARLRIVRNDANLGFGPACNRGAALARGAILIFLNPDCEVPTDAIGRLQAALRSDARIGVVGVTVCTPDGNIARGNRRRDPSLRRALSTLSGLSRFQSRWPALAGVEMPPATSSAEFEDVEAVSGACITLPRSAFERVGGFDEAYFLHAEDLDLCRRVRQAGLRVVIASTIAVTHAQGSSSRRRPLFVSRHKHRGMWRYFRRFDPAAHNAVLRGAVWLGVWAHYWATAPIHALDGYRARRMRD
jgi:N-acetylglucosaminyl-diphospho-decaprenol L-rhamnosyltransferase